MAKPHNRINDFKQIARILFAASPRLTLAAVGLNLVDAFIPSILIWLGAQLLERVVAHEPWPKLFAVMLAYALTSGLEESIRAISSFILDSLQDKTKFFIKEGVIKKIAYFPNLEIHENAYFNELATLAAASGARISEFLGNIYFVGLGIAMAIPVLLLIGKVSLAAPVLLIIGLLPLICARAKAERRSWDVYEFHASSFNAMRILEQVMTHGEFAKDLRMFDMQEGVFGQWRRHRNSYVGDAIQSRKASSRALTPTSLASGFVLLIPFCLVIAKFNTGTAKLADIAILIGGIVQLKSGITAMIYNYADMLGASYAIRPYLDLMGLPEPPKAPDPTVVEGESALVLVEQLRFRYPGAHMDALDGLDFSLRPGEKVALVGDNGAGKSTLVKLLCRLYEPGGGTIVWPGRPQGPRIAALFQDFAKFPLTTLENLGIQDRGEALAALQQVGLASLADCLDTPLTPELEHGISLSGGQWQRLAIARAIANLEPADLLVFDEPTSALDPEAESRILQQLLRLMQDKGSLIISHRMSLTRWVDRILVMEAGRIVEEGSHGSLFGRQGKYYRMYQAQAGLYV